MSTPVQQLQPNDFERRLEFVAHLIVRLEDDPHFLSKILWTDEAKFHNNGQVNHHNHHYWSDENPHWATETNRQIRWGVNVWLGIIDTHIIGPYFFEDNLNGMKYLEFLKNELPILLQDLPLQKRLNMYWQQDGAPAHNSKAVHAYLTEIFACNWIGTNSNEIKWPPRSPDMTVLDFYFWGFLKNEVYKEQSNNVNELKNKIINVCKNVSTDVLFEVTTINVKKRLKYCCTEDGKHFEHLLKYKNKL